MTDQPDLFDGATMRTRCRRDPCDAPGKARHSGAVGRHGAKRAGAPPSPGVGPFPSRPAGLPYAKDSDTSKAAAVLASLTAEKNEALVLHQLDICGPLTGQEIAIRLGWGDKGTYRVLPRLSILRGKGRVRKTAIRRMNVSGAMATAWEIVR